MPDPLPQALAVRTDDGHTLEGELAVASPERAGMVLCHPHPQYGGTMRSLVISALFAALPAAGVTCLRFNFRGVERSEGCYDEGRAERHDVSAAIGTLDAHLGDATPLVLAGWSFGADVALSSPDPRLAGWLAIAPPLRFLAEEAAVGADPRPKLVVLAQHDEFRPPAEVEALAATWSATEVQVVAGASHFFVGRTERVVEAAREFVERFAGACR
jgi:alpha/beta superfamily hydrolase